MSIIIKLQNLPWSASSADVRRFFSGLSIPDGGVHIIGGDEGNAFIAFDSDEDARQAMMRDGSRIKNSRVKLYLSSHSELQHLIEEVRRKQGLESPPRSSERSRSKDRRSSDTGPPRSHRSDDRSRKRSPRSPDHSRRSPVRRKTRSRSRSPLRYRDKSYDSGRHGRFQDEDRPKAAAARASSEREDSRYYTRRSADDRGERSSGLDYRDLSVRISNENFGDAATRRRYASLEHSWEPEVKFVDSGKLYDRRSPPPSSAPTGAQESRLQDLVANSLVSERMVTDSRVSYERHGSDWNSGEPLAGHADAERCPRPSQGYAPRKEYSSVAPQSEEFGSAVSAGSPWDFPPPALSRGYWAPDGNNAFSQSGGPSGWQNHQQRMPTAAGYGSRGEDADSKRPAGVASGRLNDYSEWNSSPPPGGPNYSSYRNPLPNYCVQMCGFSPSDSFKEVQSVLKNVYAPQANIKWETDTMGNRTGVAYIRLSNKDDLFEVLERKDYKLRNTFITVARCPDDVYYQLFRPDRHRSVGKKNAKADGLCYMMKGLPYATTEDDVLTFFEGLSLSDFVLLYDKEGKSTGVAYVEFKTLHDYRAAFERNGKKIGHRYIQLIEATRGEVDQAVKTAVATSRPMKQVLEHRRTMEAYDRNPKRRPLCALLAGLPPTVRGSQIYDFFGESGARPHAVHVILNDECSPTGRAFAEFQDLFDFDNALKQNQKTIDGHVVSVKQVLFEEMLKILDTYLASHTFAEGGGHRMQETEPPVREEPEKVPYLWEPPDETEEPRMAHRQDNANSYFQSPGHYEQYRSGPVGELSGRLSVTSQRPPSDFPQIPPGVERRDSSSHGYGQEMSRSKRNFFANDYLSHGRALHPPDGGEAGAERAGASMGYAVKTVARDRQGHEIDARRPRHGNFAEEIAPSERERAPVKFEMKGRQQIPGGGKVNDAFVEHEEKRVLKKLTPEREPERTVAPKADANSDDRSERRAASSAGSVSRGRYPEEGLTYTRRRRDRSPSDGGGGDESDRYSRSRRRSRDRSRHDGRRDRHPSWEASARDASDRGRRSPPPRDQYPERQERYACRRDSPPKVPVKVDPDGGQFSRKGSTVQADNVHPDVGLEELLSFFSRYKLRGEDIIRRFTDGGRPTGDVRIAFSSPADAAEAMRSLNGVPLRGIPIHMFFV